LFGYKCTKTTMEKRMDVHGVIHRFLNVDKLVRPDETTVLLCSMYVVLLFQVHHKICLPS